MGVKVSKSSAIEYTGVQQVDAEFARARELVSRVNSTEVFQKKHSFLNLVLGTTREPLTLAIKVMLCTFLTQTDLSSLAVRITEQQPYCDLNQEPLAQEFKETYRSWQELVKSIVTVPQKLSGLQEQLDSVLGTTKSFMENKSVLKHCENKTKAKKAMQRNLERINSAKNTLERINEAYSSSVEEMSKLVSVLDQQELNRIQETATKAKSENFYNSKLILNKYFK